MGVLKMANNLRLSICMIVKDEENNLPRCLNSIKKLVDQNFTELIIVDTGSTDNTIEIARQYTKHLYFHEWNNNFSDMRNISISYAKGEWIFILDADEEVEDINKLITLIQYKDLKKYNTISIQARNYLNNDKDTYVVNKTERLFRNNGFRYEGSIHNQPIFKQPVLFLDDIWINHYGYDNDDQELMEKKYQRTSKLLIEELKKNPENIYYHFQLCRTYGMHQDRLLALEEIRLAYQYLNKRKDASAKKKYIYIFNEYAKITFELKLYEESVKISEEGLSINENYIDLYFYLGKALEKLGRDEEAFDIYNKYLKLYEKYEQGFDDISLLEQYKLDNNSKQEIKFRLANYEYNKGNYQEALNDLEDLKINSSKIILMTKVCLDSKKYNRLFDFYKTVEGQETRNYIINLVEEKLKEEKNLDLISTFSTDESLYGALNQIRSTNDINVIKQIFKSLYSKYNLTEELTIYTKIVNELIENNIQVFSEFKKIESSSIKNIVLNLISDSESNLNYFLTYLNNTFIRENDFHGNRIYIALANVVLLHVIETKKDKKLYEIQPLFEKYLKYGRNYIIFKYGKEKINYLYRFEENKEEKFLMIMTLYNEKKSSLEIEFSFTYLKEASEVYPYFAKFLKSMIKSIQVGEQAKNIIHKFENIKNQSSLIKILQGTMEIANQASTLASAQSKISGVSALSLNYYPNYLQYNNSVVLDIDKYDNKKEIANLILEKAIETFDVFHFHFNTSIMPDLSDIPLLREQKKKIFMHHWGTDVRRLSISKKLNPYAKSKNVNEEYIVKQLDYLGKHIEDCIVADAELYENVKGFYNRIHFVPQALNLDKYVPNPDFQFRKKKPVIVHAPTSSDFKGTKFVNTAIEELRMKYDIDYILVQNMSHEEAKRIYQEADIVVDQLHSAGHGLLSLEAMAMNKPVICSISEQMKDFYPKDIPIVSATPENIKKQLEQLINDYELRKSIGEKGRKYVEKYHDHTKIAEILINIYTN